MAWGSSATTGGPISHSVKRWCCCTAAGRHATRGRRTAARRGRWLGLHHDGHARPRRQRRGTRTVTTPWTRSSPTSMSSPTKLDVPPVLVGASIGGMTAAIANAESGIGRALVLVDVTVCREPEGSQRIHEFISGRAGWFSHRWTTRPRRSGATTRRSRTINVDGLQEEPAPRRGRPLALALGSALFEPCRRAAPDRRGCSHVNAARHITVPTLIVRGSDLRRVDAGGRGGTAAS